MKRRPRGREDLGEEEDPLERRGFFLIKPHHLPENFPHVPAVYRAKSCFAFVGGGDVGEVFRFGWEVEYEKCGYLG